MPYPRSWMNVVCRQFCLAGVGCQFAAGRVRARRFDRLPGCRGRCAPWNAAATRSPGPVGQGRGSLSRRCEARRHYARRFGDVEVDRGIAQLEEAGRLAGDDATLWTRLAEMQLPSAKWNPPGKTLKNRSNSIRNCPVPLRFTAASCASRQAPGALPIISVRWATPERPRYPPGNRRTLSPVEPARPCPANLANAGRNLFAGEEPGRVEYLLAWPMRHWAAATTPSKVSQRRLARQRTPTSIAARRHSTVGGPF